MYRTNINGEIYLRTSILACLELEFSPQNYILSYVSLTNRIFFDIKNCPNGISRTADLEYLKKQNDVTDKSLLISLHIFFFAGVNFLKSIDFANVPRIVIYYQCTQNVNAYHFI